MRPSERLIRVLAAVSLLGIAIFFYPPFKPVWYALLGLLMLIAIADLVAVARSPLPGVERRIAHSIPLAVEKRVELYVRNESDQTLRTEIFDHHPDTFVVRDQPQFVRLGAMQYQELSYRARPTERGRHEFDRVELRLYSPLTLWTRQAMVGEKFTVNVFPNFAEVSKYAILGVDSSASAGSIHTRPLRGEGSEFHQLREYRVGDTFRQIDWKATARLSRLITKEYQEERDQQIVFMLDTGRRMLAREDDLSHFDHVLNAMLLLAYVALRQGDAVGFMTCTTPPLWMKPRKGLSAVNVLANRLFDVQPEPVAVDYQAAATQLALRQKRRALIVLLTNIRDEDTDELKAAFRLLRRRHLLLVASLREPGIDSLLHRPIDDFGDALDFASGHHYLDSRRTVHESVSGKGVFIEDTSCALLPYAIANRYMEIKRARLL